ncbi:hypothetical protein A9Q84_09500 [Halobacteriovorax marinus]|uniref:Cytochrome c domain-containing protein n=1 Tax=Halobacteriovorax marinus TaxID=97084 RepID=A0A1Y5F6Z9_9BACT|nr:hypothetical protein A9Q84_09500 [Halobacteriovorax marinus]
MKILFITLSLLLSSSLFASARGIFFKKGNESINIYSLEHLKSLFKVHQVSIYNPSTRKTETYNAFSVNAVFKKAFSEKIDWKSSFAFTIHTRDQYKPIIETYKFLQREAYLAFERTDLAPFRAITEYGEKLKDLSPFYLIWIEDKEKVPSRRRSHWPYQVTGFSISGLPPKYLIPGPKASKKISYGYKNVRKHCLACHTINGFGSKKAGELVSNGLVEFYSDKKLMRFISKPRNINPLSKMPIFSPKIDHRTDRIRNIVHYLRYITKKNKSLEMSNGRIDKTKKLNKALKSL